MTGTKPTICQVLHSLTVGGAEVLAADLARRMGDRYRFLFACLDHLGTLGEELRREGFEVAVIERRPGVDLACMKRLARFWRDHRVSLVHAHQYTPFFYAMGARKWRSRPPLLFTEHGRWYPDYPRRKRILFNRLMLRRGDRVIGVGESVRRALIDNEGIPPGRVGVIHNGVDVAAFEDAAAHRADVRRELHIGDEDLVVAQVARLDHLKDHATAIRTIARVARRRGDVRLLLVGEGPEQEMIEAEVFAHRLDDNVRLLGLRGDVPRLLGAADLFLLTSISEGIPVTLIEAMAAGLPVVATKVGGVAEIVERESSGLLASPGDDEALAEAVLRLAEDRSRREAMGRQGRRRACDLFSQERMHQGYRDCYEEMLRG